MLSARVTEPVYTGLTDKVGYTSTIVNAEQPLTGECSELEPELGRCWEFEQDSTQISDVQGRLFPCLSFWEQVLEAPPQVLECIKVGYKLLPEPYQKPNHKSALINHDFVSQAVADLEQNRCIRKSETVPVVCSPLSIVASSAGKKRLVIDLWYLNEHLLKDSFKYEDLRIAMLLFDKEDFLLKFDLKSGYHHLDIFEPHQSFLGFSWGLDNERKYFVFTVLPFGLASACYVFTKLMRPLIRHWRGQGIRVVLYLDDGIAAIKGRENATKVSKQIQSDLVTAGFIVNEAKLQWSPTRSIVWLGFQIDLEMGQLMVPDFKLQSLLDQIHRATENHSIPA